VTLRICLIGYVRTNKKATAMSGFLIY